MSVLALHRDLLHFIAQQKGRPGAKSAITPAKRRRVGVMGLVVRPEPAERLKTIRLSAAGRNRSPRILKV